MSGSVPSSPRMRSFRVLLGVRVTLAMTAAVGAVALLSYLGLRQVLDRELNASLVNVASIQAAAVTDDPNGEMRFQEWDLSPSEAASIRDLNRFAQIWSADGESLVRMRSISEDLPLDTTALHRAAGGELAQAEGSFQGVPIRALYYPLERLGELHTRHVLQVAASLEARNRTLATVGIALLAILATLASSTYLGAWWLAGSTIRPVGAIIDQAEDIAQGSPRRRIEAFADTWEYHRLVQVLNRMLGRLEAALETQRRFTADASHELRTPLTVLRGELEVALRRNRTGEEYIRVLESALEEAERLSRLADDLLTLTRSEAGVLEPQIQEVDLAERVHRTLDRFSGESELGEVEIIGPLQGPLFADVDPDLMDRVVWNLVGNSLKYSPPGGRIEVSLAKSADAVVLEVSDTGPGIPPDKIQKVFERFYRIDESRTLQGQVTGTGLGLAIARAIVDLHRGEITAGNLPDGGAAFRVVLPVSSDCPPKHEETFMNL